MKGGPKSLAHVSYISAKRLYDCRNYFESGTQFWSGSSFGEPQIRREDKHGVVKSRTSHGDTLEGVSPSGRSACRFPESYCEFFETLDCNCCDNRIPVFEMRIEDGLTKFDFFGEAADCNGIPSFALCDHARCRDNAMLALSPLPTFPLGDTQSSISQTAYIISRPYRRLTK